eukprot:c21538_g1_i1 orf=1-2763(-)
MVAVKKFPSTRTDLGFRPQNFNLNHRESKPFAGFIFVCSNGTIPDLERKIFGLPLTHAPSVRAIEQGMPLFLFNYSTRCLCGVFEAASDGGLNLDPYAWENIEVRRLGKPPVSRYPAQVRVNLKFERQPLHEETFRPVLDHIEGHKFRLELTAYQVKQLLKLFSVPEEEFFGDKSKKWLQGIGIGNYVPESPRSAFKSDSDCYSECSSKGTYYGEEESADEDGVGKDTQLYLAYGNGEQYLSDRISHLYLNDMQSINSKVTDENHGENLLHDTASLPRMPFLLDGSNSTAPYNQQSTWKRNSVRAPYGPWPETLEPTDVNQMLSRFCEADPAVNSNAVYFTQAGVHQPQREDEAEMLPFMPVHMQSPFFGYENMIYIPAPTQPRQSLNLLMQAKGSELRTAAGGLLTSKQALNSENHEKISNPRSQKLYPRHHPIYLQGPQCAPVLVPFCAARPTPVYESNHMATVLAPVFLSPFGQGLTLAQPQFSSNPVEEGGEGAVNCPQLLAGGCHNLLHNGQFPLFLVPSGIPRIPPSPPSSEPGFVEALHFNILHFARLTRPSAETQLFVEASIDCIRSCVRTKWPDADVEVFGSFATGLCLQHSDVDIAVVNAPLSPALVNMTTSQASSFLLRELGVSLKSSECCESYNVIANASVPVLKCYCRPIVNLSDPSLPVPPIAIDITIGCVENRSHEWKQAFRGPNVGKLGARQHAGGARGPNGGKLGAQQHTGGAAREYVLSKARELPALAPLVLLMKSFLHHKGLSNVYLGGLGSFSLTLLLAYYLERVRLCGEASPEKVSKNLPASQKPVSCLTDFSEELEEPFTKSNIDGLYSSYKSADVNESLGEYYVRKAAGVIEDVLALWDAGGVASLGTYLLGFLRTFGFDLDLAREKIVLKGIDGSPGGIFKRDNRHIALWIDDPLRP